MSLLATEEEAVAEDLSPLGRIPSTRRRTSPESHQADASLPGETGKEALFLELPPGIIRPWFGT